LTAIQKSRAKQKSRLTWLRLGDANTKYFHLMANARKKKNHIHILTTDNGVAVSEAKKQSVIHEHFTQHIGSYLPRSHALNFSALGWQPKPLHHLHLPISETEVHMVIKSAPKEKPPGSDGFIGLFFLACREVISEDLMMAVQHFINRNQQGLHLLNQAYIVLIPKKTCPQRISEYRPINLVHSFEKIITKVLANRLGSELQHLVSISLLL
jgi:hypothetical protein